MRSRPPSESRKVDDGDGRSHPRPALTQADASWSMIHAVAYGSLIIPVLLAAALWLKDPRWHDFLLTALLTHMALVVTFLGGVHWGIAMRYMATDARLPAFHFLWGPVPGYAAWFLLMAGPQVALIGMMVLTVWTYWVDHRTWPGSGLGPWMPLRRTFTLGTLVYGAIALAALSL